VFDAWLGTGNDETWSKHRLNYAILGGDDLKQQISFKYRAASELDLFLAFTSIIVWDIYEDSLPILDITFQPELFYRAMSKDNAYSFDTGYWHNSNGKDGSASRAWDRLFVRGNYLGSLLDRECVVSATAYVTLYESDKNGDIGEYLGNWDVDFAWRSLIDPQADDLDLLLTLVAGRDEVPFDRGQLQLGLRYRIPNARFNPRLFAQYFLGYGDTLLEYNYKKSTLRLGLAF